jgi:serine/threonine protein kinase
VVFLRAIGSIPRGNLVTGKTFSHYKILNKLTTRELGVVYVAEDAKLGCEVALKIAHERAYYSELFQREAQVATQLSHDNIVRTYEWGEEDGRAYIATELIEGEDLFDWIHRREKMSLEEKLQLMLEICDGLSYAHRAGVIHKNINPRNIYVTSSGRVKIMGFGEATSDEIVKVDPHHIVGNLLYFSPEQIKGHSVDHRTDIFSAGITFYELLTRSKPFRGENLFSTVYKIVHEAPEPADQKEPTVPKKLSAAVSRCLAKEPGDRYQHIDEMARVLRGLRDGGDVM